MRIANININAKVVCHLGCYWADEIETYRNSGVKTVVWAEANPLRWDNLDRIFNEEKTRSNTNHLLFKGAITDKDDEVANFKLYNYDEASSLFDIGKDLGKFYPGRRILGNFNVPTITVDTMLDRFNVPIEDVDYLAMDLQGSEQLALAGASRLLKSPNLKFIQSEAVFSEHYAGGAKGKEVCEILQSYGFKIVAEKVHPPSNDQFDLLFQRVSNV